MSTKRSRDADTRTLHEVVWKFWSENRRDLPWRKTRDPYKIMVSEIMLQQTQVARVLEKYKEFLKAFPTVHDLAGAKLADVLRVWSGLGYNRRAKYLHEAAKVVVREYSGKMPRTAESLEQLPGIGKYTARAICAFAYNTSDVFIETNIRSVFLHHFFPNSLGVHDRELLPLIERAAEGQEPRQWYAALMDYGSYLKQTTGNESRRSAHHVVQKRFKGSAREARGQVLKVLQNGSLAEAAIITQSKLIKERTRGALLSLQKDGLVRKLRTHWGLA